ncbi:thioredoxin family protein [Paenibacillus athensensis]|uniref:Thioredoxin n=1 Tax=Paenibacillus athensensis TaxID=1967502 RepID=A0A4Y8PTZ4_9BACL|nr:thioredoxin family protein [Paenibacillus athensensis]MCD1261556.1 thioredoxin family protein [Paenibacillus athensensis]
MAIQTVHSDEMFQGAVASTGVTLVDFGAAWCAPCKTLLPILDQLDREQPWLTIVKVDVDYAPSSAALFGVMSMPTVVVFKDGQAVDKLVGLRSKEAYLNIAAKYA